MICLYDDNSGQLLGGYNLDHPFFNHTQQAELLNRQIHKLHVDGIAFRLCSENQYYNRPQPDSPTGLQ